MSFYWRQFKCPYCQSTNVDEEGTRVDGTWDCTCLSCDRSFTADEDEDEDEDK
jgi:transposase-like protein